MARKSKPTADNDSQNPETSSSPVNIDTDSHVSDTTKTTSERHSESGCGQQLQTARIKAGLSVQEVASQLRLSEKQILALESNQFEQLPEPPIVRGFIRNYAKLLKLEAQPVLEAYARNTPETAPPAFAVKSTAHAAVINAPNHSFRPIAIVAGLLVLFAIGLYLSQYLSSPLNEITQKISPELMHSGSESELTNTIDQPPPSETTAVENPAPQLQAQLEEPRTEASNNDTLTTPITLPSSPTSSPVEQQTQIKSASLSTDSDLPNPDSTSDMIAASSTQSSTSDQAASKLQITAHEETWVNIIDGSGKQIYSQLLPAGTSHIIQAKPPLNITVGNALSTSLFMNGKEINLAPYTRDKVAHLRISE